MARTVRLKVYKFNELSAAAKQKAMDNYLAHEDFSWITEDANESLEKFISFIGISRVEVDYHNYGNTSCSFRDIDDNVTELQGQRLATYIWNNYRSYIFKGKYYGKLVDTFPNGEKIPVSKAHPAGTRHVKRYSNATIDNACVLTGVCYDMDLLQPIYDFLDKPDSRDFRDLILDCLISLSKSVRDEIEGNSQEDAIAEHFDANGYEFTADGEIY